MTETELHKKLRIIWQLNLANQGYYSETHKYFSDYIPDVYGEKSDSIKVVEIINSSFSGKHPKDWIPNPDKKPIIFICIDAQTGNQTHSPFITRRRTKKFKEPEPFSEPFLLKSRIHQLEKEAQDYKTLEEENKRLRTLLDIQAGKVNQCAFCYKDCNGEECPNET